MTSVDRPLRADAEQNRIKIIAAAAEVFAERGMAATLDDVAHRAGVGVGTVYRRFPDKESLLDAIFYERVTEILDEARELSLTRQGWPALVGFMTFLCQLQSQDRALKEVMYTDGRHLKKTEILRAELEPILVEMIEKAKADGQLRPDADGSDIPVLMMMVAAASEYTHTVKPDAWKRFLTILLDGWRDNPGNVPLPVDALDAEELDKVMAAKGI